VLRPAGVRNDEATARTRHSCSPPPGTGDRRVDQYGRLLRYVVRVADGVNVNAQLVRVGAAAPYFYAGRRGRYAALLERLALRGSDFFVFLRGGVCAEIRCARRSSARTVARLTLTTAEHAAAAVAKDGVTGGAADIAVLARTAAEHVVARTA
jgi:Staphylococcal nuclease homologue